MESTEPLIAVFVLLIMLFVGTVAHELAHATVLRAFGVPYEMTWLPDRDSRTVYNVGLLGTWATVTPRSIPRKMPVWGLRLSAIAPLVLATPLLMALVGVVPGSLDTGNLVHIVFTVTWLGFALPSPQDFSLFWYAERAIEMNDRLEKKRSVEVIHSTDATTDSG